MYDQVVEQRFQHIERTLSELLTQQDVANERLTHEVHLLSNEIAGLRAS